MLARSHRALGLPLAIACILHVYTPARVALAAPTSGETAPKRVRDALKGPALEAFDRGSALFGDGDPKGARAEFERAYELSKEPRVLYNIAVCDKAVRRYARALDELRRSLSEGEGKLPAAYVRTANDTIATLEPYVSKLEVVTSPDGAMILVDGEPLGTTPLAAQPMEVGEHLVVARKGGFVESTQRVRVTSGEVARLTVTLEPATQRGKLVVRAAGLPAGTRAVVVVDGVEIGDAPADTMLEAGPHTVSVRAPGFATASRRVEVAARGEAEASFTLERDVRTGRVRVRTDEEGDVIELDGRAVGRGSYDARIPAGEHQLRVRRGGADPRVVDFVLAENETRTMSISLGKSGGVPTLVWVAGGAVLVGAATTLAIVLGRSTTFEGSTPGTLPPRVIPAASPWSPR